MPPKKRRPKRVYAMFGFGDKSQFADMSALMSVIEEIAEKVPRNATFLYFGDTPKADAPDVGYAFELLVRERPDIKLNLIQISAAKSWGLPPTLVDNIASELWHDDFADGPNKWGGVDATGNPQSNTKVWFDLARRRKIHIMHAWFLGGGDISVTEMLLMFDLDVPVSYAPLRRKFAGDKTTLVTDSSTVDETYGPVFREAMQIPVWNF